MANTPDKGFTPELIALLQNFDKDKAINLSDRIHVAEQAGYFVGMHEDRLWSRLTDKIEKANHG